MSPQDRTPPAPGTTEPAPPASIPRQRGNGGDRRRRKTGWKRWIKPVAIGTAVSVAAGCGGVYLYIQHLNSNITKAPKSAGNAAPPAGKADAHGRTAMNILLIGTDSRKGLGGKYGDRDNVGQGNNDVDIVLHVYPDRQSAVAVDLPRDTLINHPSCTDPVTKQVYPPLTRMPLNMALSRGGPGCVVDTVQKITNLRIDHFMMVNFQGIKDLTNAVGGVDVNLCQPIHDSDSHLDLPAGPSHLNGDQGLAFVRTRHAVQDGSAVGRFSMQRAFLSSLLRQMTSAGTLLNPTKLTPLAEAATKALTVDPDLGSVQALMGLADGLKGIKPDKVAFVQPKVSYTPRNLADPDRSEKDEFVQPEADQIFALLLADRPVTGKAATRHATASASPTTSPTPAVVPSQVTVEVLNGTTRQGAAGTTAQALTALGYHAGKGNAGGGSVAASTVTYAQADQEAAAQSVARALGLPSSSVRVGGTGRGVTVVIGADFPTSLPSTRPSTPAPTALPTGVKVHKADDTSCTSKGNGTLSQ